MVSFSIREKTKKFSFSCLHNSLKAVFLTKQNCSSHACGPAIGWVPSTGCGSELSVHSIDAGSHHLTSTQADLEMQVALAVNGRLHVQSSSPAFALISEMQIQFQSSNWKFPVTALLTNTLQKKTLFFILLFYFPLYQLNSFNSW